jgi:hypothetical protein
LIFTNGNQSRFQKNQETTMFKKSIFIAAMLIVSSAAFNTAEAGRRVIGCDPTNAPGGVCVVDHQPAPPIRDHRCPASQGGNCVGPEPAVIQCLVAPCPVIPPPPRQPTQCNDPRLCDNFGNPRPPRRPVVVIIDPIDMGPAHYRISCREGRNIVRHRGFRRVHPIDCSGNEFTYEGQRRGRLFEISVNLNGNIVSVDRAY